MNRLLKKITMALVIMLPLIINNGSFSYAYSDEEETSDEYTTEMQENVINRVNEIRAISPYTLKRSNDFIVVLDPGHGGADPGASGNGIVEKKVNLEIANAVKAKLESYGVNVVMTRDTDLASNKKLELSERAAIANELGADLFISLHNDYGGGDGAHVIHSIKGGLSKVLATDIANSIKNNTIQNLKKNNPVWSRSYTNDKGQVVDYYGVIRMTKMPAVIVEHAYLDNANDVTAINTPTKVVSMGNAVAKGIYKTIEENFGTWEEIDGDKYYYDHNGVMATGWLKYYNGNWYYFNENGVMQTGWKFIDGSWYYLDDNGVMATGWLKLDEKWYYLKSNGIMAEGWEFIDGSWYYFTINNGAMKTGWQFIDGSWYYLKEKGMMAIGWQLIDGEWYYFKEKGMMAEGWQKVDGKWYYLKSNGAMATGWLELNGKKYYLKPNGEMVTGKVTIDNKVYTFDQSGALI